MVYAGIFPEVWPLDVLGLRGAIHGSKNSGRNHPDGLMAYCNQKQKGDFGDGGSYYLTCFSDTGLNLKMFIGKLTTKNKIKIN